MATGINLLNFLIFVFLFSHWNWNINWWGGKKVMKIDMHRGPVVNVAISSTSQVLVSGSHDATICLWSLETYELLNLMQFNSPVLNFRLSPDSVSMTFTFLINYLLTCAHTHTHRSFCLLIAKITVFIYEHLQPERNFIS